jgi:hypothetical protein
MFLLLEVDIYGNYRWLSLDGLSIAYTGERNNRSLFTSILGSSIQISLGFQAAGNRASDITAD